MTRPIRVSFVAALPALIILLAGLLTFATAATRERGDAPVRDKRFETRLTETKTYRTQPGDTLRGVAHLLYGHETWWTRLRRQNSGLIGYGADDRLPVKTAVKYRAAKVGDLYVVQDGDWLIRIAMWKYGDTDQWEEIFRKNAGKIGNPNLIHPGDRLSMKADGTVTNENTGQTIIGEAVPPPNPTLPPMGQDPALAAHSVETSREPARAHDPEPSFLEWTLSSPYFLGGMLAALALLLLGPLTWWYQQRQAMRMQEAEASPGFSPEATDRYDEAPEYEPYVDPAMSDEKMWAFKKRPIEFNFDKSLIPHEDGDVPKKTGYHRLIPKKLRKYWNQKKKH